MSEKETVALAVVNPIENLKKKWTRKNDLIKKMTSAELATHAAFSGLTFMALSKAFPAAAAQRALATQEPKAIERTPPTPDRRLARISDEFEIETGERIGEISKLELAQAFTKLKRRYKKQKENMRMMAKEDARKRRLESSHQEKAIAVLQDAIEKWAETEGKKTQALERSIDQLVSAHVRAATTPPAHREINLGGVIAKTANAPAGSDCFIEIDPVNAQAFKPKYISIRAIDPHAPGTNYRIYLQSVDVAGIPLLNVDHLELHNGGGIISDVFADPIAVDWPEFDHHSRLRIKIHNPNGCTAKVFVQVWGEQLER